MLQLLFIVFIIALVVCTVVQIFISIKLARIEAELQLPKSQVSGEREREEIKKKRITRRLILQKKRKISLAILAGIGIILLMFISLLPLRLPKPSIYPLNGELTKENTTVRIKNDSSILWATIFCSTDPQRDPVESGVQYTGPFIPDETGYIYAQSRFLFWRSDVETIYAIKMEDSVEKYGLTEGDASRPKESNQNRFVSDEYMADISGALPDGVDCGYGDSSKDGLRPTYTIDQINHGSIDEKIVMNSISDAEWFGSEIYFTQIREADTANYWNANGMEVEIGKEYVVRIYIHNNNPRQNEMVAKDVKVQYVIPMESGRTIGIQGMISSTNATPDLYWDGVILTCKDRFHVEVVENSAMIEGKGSTSGTKIPDAVNGWATIGYNSMNGEIPGCYGYSQIATVRLKVVAN